MTETPSAADVRAYDEARTAGDVDAMAAAALRLANGRMFGTVPGRVPAFLHQAYARATGRRRTLLAVAMARTWAYGGDPARAATFAQEALSAAESDGDPELLAQALDAHLLTRWGPDDLDERLRSTARLEDAVAHLSDPELRMNAHLWRLTTALECLDASTLRRQLRALELLAAETRSHRVRFFAASRRGMYALLVADVPGAEAARQEAVESGYAAGEPDAFAIDRALTASIARQSGDLATLAAEAERFEEFAEREAVSSIAAEAAQMWALLGETERATRLLHQLAGADFSGVVRDVDWLLTMTALTDVSVAVGDRSRAAHAVRLLEPYAGRGVANAGAVGFAGVVDDYLARATGLLGEGRQDWWTRAAEAYRQLGATWWLGRCGSRPRPAREGSAVLCPTPGGGWQVGSAGRVAMIRDMLGLHYLRLLLQRPGVDVPAAALSDAAHGHPGDAVRQTPLPQLDRAAAEAYRRRLAALDDELEQAADRADGAGAERLEQERAALLRELRSAAGLTGRARPAGSTDERARVAVRKAISAAIARVAAVDAPLGRLLADTISTGSTCRYDPDPGRATSWRLDPVDEPDDTPPSAVTVRQPGPSLVPSR